MENIADLFNVQLVTKLDLSISVNSTDLFMTCGLDGRWSQPPINCQFDPTAVSYNSKKGRSLDWNVANNSSEINIGTIATIGILASLVLLAIIIFTIIISHRRLRSETNLRKISRSSTNQLIPDTLVPSDSDECKVRMLSKR